MEANQKGDLADTANTAFSNFDAFKEAFSKAASGNFGSGWNYDLKSANGDLKIVNTDDAEMPTIDPNLKPLLTQLTFGSTPTRVLIEMLEALI